MITFEPNFKLFFIKPSNFNCELVICQGAKAVPMRPAGQAWEALVLASALPNGVSCLVVSYSL